MYRKKEKIENLHPTPPPPLPGEQGEGEGQISGPGKEAGSPGPGRKDGAS